MSAYLASSDCISALVTYWESRCNAPGALNTESNLHRAYCLFFQSIGRTYPEAWAEAAEFVKTKLSNKTPAEFAFQTLLVQNQESL